MTYPKANRSRRECDPSVRSKSLHELERREHSRRLWCGVGFSKSKEMREKTETTMRWVDREGERERDRAKGGLLNVETANK